MKSKRKITYKEFIQFHIDYMKVALIGAVVIIFMCNMGIALAKFMHEVDIQHIEAVNHINTGLSIVYVLTTTLIYFLYLKDTFFD